MKNAFQYLSLVVLLLSVSSILFNDNLIAQAPYRATRITGGIDFDGVPDEPAWEAVESFRFLMHDPANGKEPVQKSIVKLCYDDKYLYLGSALYYIKPGMISAIGKIRDYASWDTDWIGMSIDTYNDKRNLIILALNPNGIRCDASVKNDFENGMKDINFSYNTFWDGKVKIADSIWYSELRIPLSSLRFQGNQEKVVMGMTFWRNIANSKNPDYGRSAYPHITLDKGENLLWRPSVAGEVEFQGLVSRKPAYITPYLLAGANTYFDGTDRKSVTDFKYEAGGDIKLGLSNNVTLDLTVNTDFAQVEADQEQFNLTRFSLFFPEKRLFFQEKSDVFDFTFSRSDNLFYSRNIGLSNGNPVRLYGGLRLTGRAGNWDFGLMDMQTADFESNPGENFAVFRTKRTIINSSSFIGGIVTSRISTEGVVNTAYGVDARIRPVGDEYFTLKIAQTLNEGAGTKFTDLSATQVYLNWQRIRYKGFSYNFLYNRSGEKFSPSSGVETRDNFSNTVAVLKYGWLAGKESFLNQHQIIADATLFQNSVTGDFETIESSLGWSFNTKKTLNGIIEFIGSVENLPGDYYIVNPGVFVPTGTYSFFMGRATLYFSNPGRTLGSNLILQGGSFYDGARISGTYTPSLNLGRSVIFNGTYRIDRIKFDSRDQKYTNHIFGLRGRYMFTTKLSLTTYVQFNTFSDRIVANARIRYNAKEGSDFYIVYNEGIDSSVNTNFRIDNVNENRTFLLKYTYTFAL